MVVFASFASIASNFSNSANSAIALAPSRIPVSTMRVEFLGLRELAAPRLHVRERFVVAGAPYALVRGAGGHAHVDTPTRVSAPPGGIVFLAAATAAATFAVPAARTEAPGEQGRETLRGVQTYGTQTILGARIERLVHGQRQRREFPTQSGYHCGTICTRVPARTYRSAQLR